MGSSTSISNEQDIEEYQQPPQPSSESVKFPIQPYTKAQLIEKYGQTFVIIEEKIENDYEYLSSLAAAQEEKLSSLEILSNLTLNIDYMLAKFFSIETLLTFGFQEQIPEKSIFNVNYVLIDPSSFKSMPLFKRYFVDNEIAAHDELPRGFVQTALEVGPWYV